MTTPIALCADSASLEDPSQLGIQGERLLDQTWIVPFADALIARQYLRKNAVAETWVVSSDSVDGINLAAALKKDNQNNNVKLFLSSPSGSKMSRCQNAGIIPICGSREFARLYAAKKLAMVSKKRYIPLNEDVQIDRSCSPENTDYERTARATNTQRSDDAPVTVRRIDRTHTTTEPLPTIDIEEAPDLAAREKRIESGSQPNETHCKVPRIAAQEETIRAKRPKSALPSLNEGANVVSVVSGSGGTGKSSITALTALIAQNRGIRTLILDADFQFGDLKYLMGYKDAFDASDILEHPEQIEALLKVETWPALIAAPAKLEYSEVMEEHIGDLLAYLKPHFDLIVVNTGSFWSDLQIQLLEASNQVFFLVDQRPSSVRACNHALDLCDRCGIATTSFSYLLNFCSKRSLLSALDVSCALKGAKVHEVKDGGAEVSELLGAGMAHKLSKLNNSFCSSVESLLKEALFERIKPSLAPTNEKTNEKQTTHSVKGKLRGRQKRRAACL